MVGHESNAFSGWKGVCVKCLFSQEHTRVKSLQAKFFMDLDPTFSATSCTWQRKLESFLLYHIKTR